MKQTLIRFAMLSAALSVAMVATVTLAPILQYAFFRYVASSIDAPDPGSPSPLPSGPDTVFIEDMTWMEVRDAMKAGKKTVIVPTGGVEQNGPYLVMGKHNLVCRACSEVIARKLGEYFASGTRLAWIVDPKTRTVRVHTSPTESTRLDADTGVLDGGDVLPGFRLPVADLFPGGEA